MIVDCDDKFINIVTKWPGSSHDSRVFKESVVYRNLENNNIDGYPLGDSGYACKTSLLTPYLRTRHEQGIIQPTRRRDVLLGDPKDNEKEDSTTCINFSVSYEC